jgi:endonuclease-8
LFIAGLNPWTPVSAIADARLQTLIATAHRLLQQNAATPAHSRITTHGDRAARGNVYAYGRSARPCYHCQTPIQSRRQGPLNRLTYWCPTCQPS